MNRRTTTVALSFLLPLILAGCGITFTRSSGGGDGGVFVSIDDGDTWQQKAFVTQEKKRTVTIGDVSVNLITFDPADPNVIAIGTRERGVYRSEDRGESWHPTGLASGNIGTLAIDRTNSQIAYSANAANVLKSIDGMRSWSTIFIERPGVTVNAVVVDPVETNRVLAGTSSGGILLSEDYGNTWRVLADLKDAVRQLVIPARQPKTVYAVSATKGLSRSADGGASWKTVNPDPAKFPGVTAINSFSVTPTRPDELVIGTTYGFLVSRDAGDRWEAIETVIPFKTVPIQTATINNENPNIMYFTISNRLYRTTDGGETWRTIQTIPTTRPITVLALAPDAPTTLYVGTLRIKK